MPRKGENIHKRKDGRWEARYIKGYSEDGKAVYGYAFGKSYLEVKRKRQEDSLPPLSVLLPTVVPAISSALSSVSSVPAAVSAVSSAISSAALAAMPTVGTSLPPITQIVQIGGNISNCYKANCSINSINNVLVMNGNDRSNAGGSVYVDKHDCKNDNSSLPLLSDLALQWLESLISIRKKSTVVKYAGQLKNYILPAFGDKHIDCVTTTDLMDFSRLLLNSGRKDGKNDGHLSPRTVVNILAEMKSIKKFAVLRGFEVKYVTECVEVPRQTALLQVRGLSADNHGRQEELAQSQTQIQHRKKVLTVDEQKKLMSYLKETINDSMKDVKTDHKGWLSSFGIMLSLSTGIRLGELCALKWSDFSLEDGEFREFRIQRTMQRLPVSQLPIQSESGSTNTSGLLASNKTVDNYAVDNSAADNAATREAKSADGKKCDGNKHSRKNKNNRKTAVEIGAPKSQCSIRTIPIPEAIMPYIKSAYEAAHQAATHNIATDNAGGACDTCDAAETAWDAFLLTGTRERFTEPRTMENRFKAVLKNCGLRTINFHALRHSFATRAVELGFDVKTLSEILGHANVGITLDRYVHPSMRVKKENMDKMGEMWIK